MRFRPPGLLQLKAPAQVVLMIGTAGHVDHGKTQLVRMLTGCETDRLKEEQARGMSIELGFAPCYLGDGLAAGIVDVPGHEQFIKNMVAGAAGMDLAVLVVAADDGVMPQTIEHLQIMGFLGVRRGLVVISKIDLVPAERVAEVAQQITALCKGTFLDGATICPLSTVTLAGFEEFYIKLAAVAKEERIHRHEGVFRMPVERVFTVEGYGTVATGIPLAGSIQLGQEVEIQPANLTARVRGLQSFLRPANQGGAGQCLALNLAGITHDQITRGNVLVQPGFLSGYQFLQLHLTTCRNLNPPLKEGEQTKFHTGTVEAAGVLQLYGATQVDRNSRGFAAVRLTEPVTAAPGDHFVLRRNTPMTTVAGGVVLKVFTEKPPGARRLQIPLLADLWAARDSFEKQLEVFFLHAGQAGGTASGAARALLSDESIVQKSLEALCTQGRLWHCPGTISYLHVQYKDQAFERIMSAVAEYALEHPTPAQLQLKLKLPDKILQALIEQLKDTQRLVQHGNRLMARKQDAQPPHPQQALLAEVAALYEQARFSAPRPDELPGLTGRPASVVQPLFDYLCQTGTLIRLNKHVAVHHVWLEEAERLAVSTVQANGQMETGEFKRLLGTSRKYALAVLEHFDAAQITLRVGDVRRLHPVYVRKVGPGK